MTEAEVIDKLQCRVKAHWENAKETIWMRLDILGIKDAIMALGYTEPESMKDTYSVTITNKNFIARYTIRIINGYVMMLVVYSWGSSHEVALEGYEHFYSQLAKDLKG
jgi:hypothetical protein